MPEYNLNERLTFAEKRSEWIEKQISDIIFCIHNCRDRLTKFQKKLEPFEDTQLQDQILEFRQSIERVENILRVRENKGLSFDSETDLGKQVFEISNELIEPRWHGESYTSADITLKSDQNKILVEDKATRRDKYQIKKSDIKKILVDALHYEMYPCFSISFKKSLGFEHYFIPVEEVMSLLQKESVSISYDNIATSKINSLDINNFVKQTLTGMFPVMKYNEKQLSIWLERI